MATLQTAVVGHPIAHSLSPFLHNAIYKNEGVDAEMTAIDNERIEPLVEVMRKTPLGLTAVTLPHKQSVALLLDQVDSVAQHIGAVNTVINREGTLHGYNTDIVGIAEALKDVSLESAKVLVVGAGGAAQPLAYFLKGQGARFFCFSRDAAKTAELCERFEGTALDSMPQDQKYDVIVNATPLGLNDGDSLPCTDTLLTPGVTVFDMIYTPTRLQQLANERGSRVITGMPMFIAQGLEQERLWLGRKIRDSGYSALLLEHLHNNNETI
jgi:shikimate dehydrogenase